MDNIDALRRIALEAEQARMDRIEGIVIKALVALVIIAIAYFIQRYLSKKANSTDNIDNQEAINQKKTIERLQSEKEKLSLELKEKTVFLENLAKEGGVNTDLMQQLSLEKEIKKLKDEVDDLEDEIGDWENKYKRLNVQKSEIEIQLEEVEKNKNILLEEKQKLETINEKKEVQLKEKTKSIQFVSDILSAEKTNNKDFEYIEKKTQEILSFVENDIEDCFKNHLSKKQNNQEIVKMIDDVWSWRNSEIKSWINQKRVIAIVGEFSAGKTSIVNRILSQDDPQAPLLPVSSKETTAIPTYISGGKGFDCSFFSANGELKSISEHTFKEVTISMLEEINVSSLIKYFVLAYQNKYLDGLSILDTPGFASTSGDIIKRTTSVVKEADALFWVIDANTGDINSTSLEVMKNNLKGLPLYFIINKSDTKSDGDLQKLEEKIKITAHKNNIQYNGIVRFSQKENVDKLMNIIKKINSKPQITPLKDIVMKLQNEITELDGKIAELNKGLKEVSEDRETVENNLAIISNNIAHSSSMVVGLVSFKESFLWNSEYYRIESHDYGDFAECLGEIEELAGEIEEQTDYYAGIIATLVEQDVSLSEKKNTKKHIEDVKKRFLKLINSYNPNLIN